MLVANIYHYNIKQYSSVMARKVTTYPEVGVSIFADFLFLFL
jgi:hypothetical protein